MNDIVEINEMIAVLRETRIKKGISYRSLEKLTGVNYQHILKIEKGETMPGAVLLSKIAKGLGYSLVLKENKEYF